MADEAAATEGAAGPDTSEIVMYAAGGVLLVASFLPMLEIDIGTTDDDAGFGELFGAFLDTEWTAWSDAFSIFPMVTLPVLGVLVLVGLRALARFTETQVPARMAGFPVPVLRAATVAFAAVAVGAQVIRALVDTSQGGDGDFAIGPGGWLAVLALAALVVTTVQEAKATPARHAERRRPDARATAVVVAGAAVTVVASFFDVWSAEGEGINAWQEGARPIYLVPLVMAVLAAIATAVDHRADEQRLVLGVDLGRWRVLLGTLALFAAIALLIGNPVFGTFGSFIDTGAGVYLTLLGTAAVLVGTLLRPAATALPATDAQTASPATDTPPAPSIEPPPPDLPPPPPTEPPTV